MRLKLFFLIVLILSGLSPMVLADPPFDNEDIRYSPANYRLEKVFANDEFQINQFFLGTLSHYSYILESEKQALIVDPGRDVAVYLKFIKDKGLEVKGILLTHTHADFVAGHREMAVYTGAPIFASHRSEALFPYVEIKEGQSIRIGNALIRILETPGHTLDSVCAIVSPFSDENKPKFLFSGDTVFVGSLGRPDLMGGTISAGELADMMFDSWFSKIAMLTDDVTILPAHGAGSLCGKKLSAQSFSTIGQEKISNPYLQPVDNRSIFISRMIEDLLPAPQYFVHNVQMNRAGPELIKREPLMQKKVEYAEFDNENSFIVDVRDLEEYSAGHIPGSINISLSGKFEQWLGTMIPFNSKLAFTGDSRDVEEALERCTKIGYEASFISLNEYVEEGSSLDSTVVVSADEFNSALINAKLPMIIDVRENSEFVDFKIRGSINLPLPQIRKNVKKLIGLRQDLIIVCSSSYRSAIAAGILNRLGYKRISVLQAGIDNLVTAHPQTVTRSSDTGKDLHSGLPYPEVRMLSAADILERIKNKPEKLMIIDIREEKDFLDYSLPGSQHKTSDELYAISKSAADEKEIILIDAYGKNSLIHAAGLSIKLSRPIYTLEGGLLAYWRQTEKNLILPSLKKVDTKEEKNESTGEKQDPGNDSKRDGNKKGAGC